MDGAIRGPAEGRPGVEPIEALSSSVALQSLDAQEALLPYALAFFAVALPIFTWVVSFASDGVWMMASLVVFAINWAAFYTVVDWMRNHPARRADANLRTRIHALGGLLWAGAVAQISVLALGAGGARESMLLLAAGAAAACVFFSAASLPVLLIVSPVALLPPLWALTVDPATESMGHITLAAFALTLALSLILNRLLRRQFALAEDREGLIADRDRSLDEARRLAKSKSDLIATLSHEIRNGLSVITHVLAAAAGAGGRSAPSRDQLTAALGSAEDLMAVVNATLDNEMATVGRLDLERAAFDPARLTRELVLLYRPDATAKSLELSIHVDESLAGDERGGVLGDAGRARQILSNLIGNAIKYTLRGRIEVRLARIGDDVVRFEVADTGPGLSAEELEQAFEPFSRIERTGAGVAGAGLGLSLSRQLALLMGGEVGAESAPGIGSCFHLELPFDPAAVCERTTDERPMARAGSSAGLRVLVAEPDPLGVAMLRTVLEQLGHDVLAARDGRRALELARSGVVDLIVLGGWTSDGDGSETVRAMRASEGPLAEAPIIAMIAGDADEARLCREAGADEVLRKPVTVTGVARAMATALRRERGKTARRTAA
jgi:signal transduction histidine kinase/ActR/RegA family two-component response regulator